MPFGPEEATAAAPDLDLSADDHKKFIALVALFKDRVPIAKLRVGTSGLRRRLKSLALSAISPR
jgi:hypothetical protein